MNQSCLIFNPDSPASGNVPREPEDRTADLDDRGARIRRSALWAAYGDALGWISELTDAKGLHRRTDGVPLTGPVEWTRRIGGRQGVSVSLPQGCYSDDTQLRLATGRAIRPGGFDVEAFAKVELPVWLSYALGGGKSTSAGARNLAKRRTPWFSNTFRGWAGSGGNGAAMRIQPHVWASNAPEDARSFLPDVIRNAICTHSHPIGIMGAVVHALALAHAMVSGRCPSPADLLSAIDDSAHMPDAMHTGSEAVGYWRTAFENEAGNFSDAWSQAVEECRSAIRIAGANGANGHTAAGRYATVVDGLGLRDPARRGSGILTAVAAVGLIWCERRPREALVIAANELGTDTDTIATMAGAILGVVAESGPPTEVVDADLFRSEADRLTKIARGERPECHRYPDLLHWSAPRTSSDALVASADGTLHVRGLGQAEAVGPPIESPQESFQWQWLKLAFGQTLLIKRRRTLVRRKAAPRAMSGGNASERTRPSPSDAEKPVSKSGGTERARPPKAPPQTVAERRSHPSGRARRPFDLRNAVDFMREHRDDDKKVGAAFRRVVNAGTMGEIAAFVSVMIELVREPRRTRETRRD